MKAKLVALLAVTAAASPLLHAQAVDRANEALRRNDPGAAVRVLDEAAKAGDVAAKGTLSVLLLNLDAPHQDVQRACAMAREASAAGNARGQVTQAQCLIIGAVEDPRRFEHARALSRESMRQGEISAGFMLYSAFAADPKYAYRDAKGKPDMARYNALAAMPLEQRAEQIEALDALAFSSSRGHPKAAQSLAIFYFETVAPGNLARLKELAGGLAQSPAAVPRITQWGQQANQVAALGNTKASLRTFADAIASVNMAAMAADTRRAGGAPCAQMRLVAVQSGDLQDPVYLPTKSAPLKEAYLVKGHWDEDWKFEGCGREAHATVTFTADGWGGAFYSARAATPLREGR
jgi:hypothetical protein